MEKREVFNRMVSEGLIPVVRISSAREAMDVADAIKEGGVSFIEITMSVQGAIDVIKELTQKYKDEIIMGAGTVLDTETGRAALLAGAQFIVSPTLNLDLIDVDNLLLVEDDHVNCLSSSVCEIPQKRLGNLSDVKLA